jgi:hypothetical protein
MYQVYSEYAGTLIQDYNKTSSLINLCNKNSSVWMLIAK